MIRGSLILCAAALVATTILYAQAPTITSVTNESGSTSLCPGGIAFVNGTNLGANASAVVLTVGNKQGYVFNAFNNTTLQFEMPVDAPLGASTLKVGSSAPFNITLVQYCPGIPINNGIPAVFHSSGAPVTAAFPAAPNEQLSMQATGLGPTDPVYATGTAPNDQSAIVVTKPAVTVGGKPATVTNAFLDPNSPGFYIVNFTAPPGLSTGNQTLTLSIGGLTSNTPNLPFSTAPIISQATNAASYIVYGPSRPIAQGSIIVLKGNNMGPANIVIAPRAFQDTTLSGTSVNITVNGTTVAAPVYYTSVGQVAALVPSNTPAGAGAVTVNYNGQTGPTYAINVVANAPGIFTVASDGQGAGIVTYADYSLVSAVKAANCGGPYTTCGAANPGDALIVWATGLGPVSGADASGAGLGVNMTGIPLTVWLGNVAITPIYQGRSGCCIGEDQIVFTVPANSPVGCSVPLSLQVGNFVSNNISLPVAAAGSRTCPSVSPAFSTSNVELVSSASSFTFAGIDLKRQDQYPGFRDRVEGQFFRFALDPAVVPFALSYFDDPAPGTCQVYNSLDGKPDPPGFSIAGLNAGPQITVQGPNGSRTAANQGGDYRAIVSETGDYLVPGTFTISGPGGADVPAFSVSVTAPQMPVMTSPAPDASTPTSVTRANGLTVNWSGGSANTYIQIDGFSATDNTYSAGVSFQCTAPSAPGTFNIPPAVTMMLPANNFGGLNFRPSLIPRAIPGTGLSISQLTLQYDFFTPLTFR